MRIDATNAGKNWRAWDARRCFEPALTFADDETHQYGTARVILGPDGLPFRIIEVVRQAQRICILCELKLIIINPVEHDEVDAAPAEPPPRPDNSSIDLSVVSNKLAHDYPRGAPKAQQLSWWRKWLAQFKK